MRLFLILLTVPVVEIGLFIEIGGWIGTWPTIAIVILTALIGSALLRRQGVAAMRDLQGRLAAGEAPGRLLADGAMILVAGVLLLTPGFFTDAAGFALLFPPVRAALWRLAAARFRVVAMQASGGANQGAGWQHSGPGGATVDGEFTEVRRPSNTDGPPGGPPLGPPGRNG